MNGIRSCAILLAGLLAACGGSGAAPVGEMIGGDSDAGADASSSGDSTTSSGDSTTNIPPATTPADRASGTCNPETDALSPPNARP